MNRRFWLCPLTLGSLVVVSCGQEPASTEPNTTAEAPALASAVAGGTWTTRAPMPTPRWYLDGAVQNNSLGQPVFFAVGGYGTETGRYVRTVEAYNFANDRWTPRASLPLALAHTNGIGVIGGKLYMSGGIFQANGLPGYHPGLNVYDPVRNIWTKKADMPKRTAHGVSGVINGKLYVLAGTCNNCGPDRLSRRLYRYDPVTDVWTALAWSPNAHSNGAGAVINGKFYVAGGVEDSDHDHDGSNKLDVYDPVTNRWTTLAPMPTDRFGAGGAALQGKLYIVGRGGDDPRVPTNQVEAYDPVTNTWSTKTPMSPGRGDMAAASLTFGGKSYILAVGGYREANANEAYTP